MKCPLLELGRLSDHTTLRGDIGDCLKEECAWYDTGSDACAIWSLMSSLDALGRVLREIEQKIPLGR